MPEVSLEAIDIEIGKEIEQLEKSEQLSKVKGQNTFRKKYDMDFLGKHYPTAFVLVRELRSCRTCGDKRVSTGIDILIEYTHNNQKDVKCLRSRHDVPLVPTTLPNKVKEVQVATDACDNCFCECTSQLQLFPALSKRTYRLAFRMQIPESVKRAWDNLWIASENMNITVDELLEETKTGKAKSKPKTTGKAKLKVAPGSSLDLF